MTETSSSNHHVAWADRIGLNKQWSRDIEACSDSYGTPAYKFMVKRFKNNIPNVKDGPRLKDNINKYFDVDLDQLRDGLMVDWKQNHPQEATNDSYILQQEDKIDVFIYELLYEYMIQLLEDEGFGFYKREFDGEYEQF